MAGTSLQTLVNTPDVSDCEGHGTLRISVQDSAASDLDHAISAPASEFPMVAAGTGWDNSVLGPQFLGDAPNHTGNANFDKGCTWDGSASFDDGVKFMLPWQPNDGLDFMLDWLAYPTENQ